LKFIKYICPLFDKTEELVYSFKMIARDPTICKVSSSIARAHLMANLKKKEKQLRQDLDIVKNIEGLSELIPGKLYFITKQLESINEEIHRSLDLKITDLHGNNEKELTVEDLKDDDLILLGLGLKNGLTKLKSKSGTLYIHPELTYPSLLNDENHQLLKVEYEKKISKCN
jgi:hypothetical protein